MTNLKLLGLAVALLGCEKSPTAAPVASNQPGYENIAAANSSRPTLVPNLSVGPFRLGMTRREAESAMPLKAHPSGQFADNVRVSGAYHLVFSSEKPSPDDQLQSVQYTLTEGGGLYLDGRLVDPSVGFTGFAALLKNCGPEVDGSGGSMIPCDGRTLVKQSASCRTRDANGACQEFTHEKLALAVQITTSQWPR